MLIPDDRLYSEDHIWVKEVDNNLIIGVTDFAQNNMGTLHYLDLPSVGDRLSKGNCYGCAESSKSVSELLSPVNGLVTEINLDVDDSPETVNDSPYENGWVLRVTGYKSEDLESLLDAERYYQLISQ